MKPRHLLEVLAAVALGVGGFLVVQLVADDGGDDDPAPITEAEHDRLLDSCIASTSEPGQCPAFVLGIVESANDRGCSYSDAAAFLAAVMGSGDRRDQAAKQFDTCGDS